VPRLPLPRCPAESWLTWPTILALVAATILLPFVALLVDARLLPGARPSPAASAASSALLSSEARIQQPSEDATAEIHGRILDADGNPVNGAAVRLVSTSAPSTLLRETTTDAAGRFSLARPRVERARVVAEHDPEGVVISAELRIAKGQPMELTLVLSAGSAIGGTVVDRDDHLVAGATLSAEGVPWIVRSTTSDAAGAFRLRIVPLEATSLVAAARGYETARVALAKRGEGAEVAVRVRLLAAPGVKGDVLDPDGRPIKARVVACEGQAAEARTESAGDGTFELPASAVGCGVVAEHGEYGRSEPATVSEKQRLSLRLRSGGSIEGAVVDDRGGGVPRFDLGIEFFTTPRGRVVRGGERRSFEDAVGSFRWEKLAPGSYVFTASASGKPPTRSDPIVVSPGSLTRGVRIVLPRGGSVAGRVSDASGRPIAGVELQFDSVSSVVESTARAQSDESGGYRLEGTPAGPFTLRLQKEGFRARMISALRVAPGSTLTQDVTLAVLDGGATIEFGGIGATLAPAGEGMIVLDAVFPGDPAARAGLLAGDHIVWVDGQDASGLSTADLLQLLRGAPGTSVGIGVHRPSTGQEVDVILERGTIVR
jgi:Carboxypeptidase regulatory-like domain/PDZ domain